MEMTVKVKDEITPILQKLTDNLQQANNLLAENKSLLEQIIHGSLEVV